LNGLPHPPGITAQSDDGILTLEELERLALANNPTLAQAQARIQAARGNWVQVEIKPNPVIGYAANEIGNEGEAGQQGIIFQPGIHHCGKAVEAGIGCGNRGVLLTGSLESE
jgi:cobalt-zinc-cadmium efflux system outer membrane protein